MSKLYRTIVWLVLFALITACAAPPTVVPTKSILPAPQITQSPPTEEPLPPVKIERHPEPVDLSKYFAQRTFIPRFNSESTDGWQVDLRSQDLTKIDMNGYLADLLYADFDSKTQWPPLAMRPASFSPHQIMEIGKDPGLSMGALHKQGITGKGIGIAIVDQTLLVDHIEYKDRIRMYEEAEDITGGWLGVQMHGPAVASIAVGKTVGVAPDADLYFIATAMCSQGTYETNDFACLAKSVRRIIKINKSLPADRKIRVLSISVGWDKQSKGYAEITAAVNEAKAAGIFVISSSVSETYGFNFQGLGRSPLDDPNDFQSYEPGLWWQQRFFDHGFSSATLLVPMDSRTIASPTGTSDYVFYREGGWSWSIPYLAGTYALAAQVKPDITPEVFWDTALKTGKTIQIQHAGKSYEFGVILDPQALIAALKGK